MPECPTPAVSEPVAPGNSGPFENVQGAGALGRSKLSMRLSAAHRCGTNARLLKTRRPTFPLRFAACKQFMLKFDTFQTLHCLCVSIGPSLDFGTHLSMNLERNKTAPSPFPCPPFRGRGGARGDRSWYRYAARGRGGFPSADSPLIRCRLVLWPATMLSICR